MHNGLAACLGFHKVSGIQVLDSVRGQVTKGEAALTSEQVSRSVTPDALAILLLAGRDAGMSDWRR